MLKQLLSLSPYSFSGVIVMYFANLGFCRSIQL
jgi:hypothetical protein